MIGEQDGPSSDSCNNNCPRKSRRSSPTAYYIMSKSPESVTVSYEGTPFEIINPRSSLRSSRIVSFIEDPDPLPTGVNRISTSSSKNGSISGHPSDRQIQQIDRRQAAYTHYSSSSSQSDPKLPTPSPGMNLMDPFAALPRCMDLPRMPHHLIRPGPLSEQPKASLNMSNRGTGAGHGHGHGHDGSRTLSSRSKSEQQEKLKKQRSISSSTQPAEQGKQTTTTTNINTNNSSSSHEHRNEHHHHHHKNNTEPSSPPSNQNKPIPIPDPVPNPDQNGGYQLVPIISNSIPRGHTNSLGMDQEMTVHTWLPKPGTEEMKERRKQVERERRREKKNSRLGAEWVRCLFRGRRCTN